ncbi:signal peptidase I [Maribacter sp. 2304DJ31-5]|uniref:signal peptidase I n=1 Tax=Maribacter sp. 2304DJ31-5 TaxID=3386273 RepID=UPI0039BC6234
MIEILKGRRLETMYIKKHWRKIFFFLLLSLLLFLSLFWLALMLFGLVVVYVLIFHNIKRIRHRTIHRISKGIFFFLFIFTTSIGIKLLIVDIYRIPSSSMENTLFPGDVILVNKLTYGPKLPRSPFEISWVNLLFYMNEKARMAMDENWWPYKRLSGNHHIKQGDVLVYQLNRNFFVVKRCVAVAGDTLSIDKGKVFINKKQYIEPETIKNTYQLQIGNKRKFYRQLDSLALQISVYPDNKIPGMLKGIFSHKEKRLLENLSEVKRVEMELDTFDIKKGLFALPKGTQWTLDDMGSMIIPKKGMTVKLDFFTHTLYKRALKEHEKVQLVESNGHYYLDGKKVDRYIFKQDYCFVMGDNRKGSMDSRYIGFVPEENTIGKVQYVLFSNYQERFNWDRFFKNIDDIQ